MTNKRGKYLQCKEERISGTAPVSCGIKVCFYYQNIFDPCFDI
jgi:hypothetical protein